MRNAGGCWGAYTPRHAEVQRSNGYRGSLSRGRNQIDSASASTPPDATATVSASSAPRDTDDGPEAWPADRVQLAVQALILREHGYIVN